MQQLQHGLDALGFLGVQVPGHSRVRERVNRLDEILSVSMPTASCRTNTAYNKKGRSKERPTTRQA